MSQHFLYLLSSLEFFHNLIVDDMLVNCKDEFKWVSVYPAESDKHVVRGEYWRNISSNPTEMSAKAICWNLMVLLDSRVQIIFGNSEDLRFPALAPFSEKLPSLLLRRFLFWGLSFGRFLCWFWWSHSRYAWSVIHLIYFSSCNPKQEDQDKC